MQYRSGQIIKTIAYEVPIVDQPFMFHFGVIFVNEDNGKVYVYHNSLDKGTIKEPLEVFLSSREIEEILPSKLENLTNDELRIRFQQCQGDFDYVRYNCEHFIDCMEGSKLKSEQAVIYVLVAVVVLLVLK
tara:strand:- start:46 stop:438 length:393 start_codon:yes stop_codon:yes gene_type:complete